MLTMIKTKGERRHLVYTTFRKRMSFIGAALAQPGARVWHGEVWVIGEGRLGLPTCACMSKISVTMLREYCKNSIKLSVMDFNNSIPLLNNCQHS